jgi:hypothetical protein
MHRQLKAKSIDCAKAGGEMSDFVIVIMRRAALKVWSRTFV